MARKILLEHDEIPGIETYAVYRKNGGYKSVEKALKTIREWYEKKQLKTTEVIPSFQEIVHKAKIAPAATELPLPKKRNYFQRVIAAIFGL